MAIAADVTALGLERGTDLMLPSVRHEQPSGISARSNETLRVVSGGGGTAEFYDAAACTPCTPCTPCGAVLASRVSPVGAAVAVAVPAAGFGPTRGHTNRARREPAAPPDECARCVIGQSREDQGRPDNAGQGGKGEKPQRSDPTSARHGTPPDETSLSADAGVGPVVACRAR